MTDRVTRRVRERAIGRLQRGYVCGELGTQTFEHRVDSALRCGGRSALRQVMGDLVTPSLLERTRRWLALAAEPPSWGLLALLTAGSATVIGRAASCDFVIRNDSVSRQHAMLVREGDRVIVTDLSSTNGTLVNGRWVTQAEVRPGDRLQLGELDLLL